MPNAKHLLNNLYKVFVALVLVSNFILPTSSVQVLAAEALQSKFDRQKAEIAASINSINSKIEGAKEDVHNFGEKKTTLREEIKNVETEIKNIDNVITEINLTSAKLEGQIGELNLKINAIQADLKSLIREIQKTDELSDIQIMLASQNLGEAYNKVRNLSELQSRSDSLAKKIVDSKAQLEESQKNLAESKKNLQDARFLIANKKDSLQNLLEITQGEEAQYQQLLSGLLTQKTQLDAQAAEAQRKFQEDLAKQNANTGTSGGNNGGGGGGGVPTSPNVVGCFFEDKRSLDVPAGYFGSPTSGVITQNFACKPSHDGIDIGNASGTALYAIANCTVEKIGYESGGFGHYILLKCVLPSGSKVYPLYAHMKFKSSLIEGQSVTKGTQVGSMGATGYVTGVHLHFMLISDSYESTKNVGCLYGSSKCFNPARFINF